MTNDNTKKVSSITDEVKELHPLLSKLLPKLPNVIKVEYTHGQSEMGADFIVAKNNDVFGNTEYIGLIAKIGKVVQNFTDIERQIDECNVPRPVFGGKEKARLVEVWVVVTEHITKGAQEKIYDKFSTRKINFIDGKALEKWIDELLPNYWYDVSLEVGEYLNLLHAKNTEIDNSLNLVQVASNHFYIEQDIYDFPRFDYRIKLKKLQKKATKVDIHDVIKSNKFVLIEGGMGAGKSKLLRKLVDYHTRPDIYSENKTIPVITSFKELHDEYKGNVTQLIQNKLGSQLYGELSEYKCLLLIDGFDEKNLPADKQIEALKSINSIIKADSNVKAVVTSRYLKGLDQSNELEDDISRVEIRPLSLSKTILFISTICNELNMSKRIIEDLKKSPLFRELPKSPIAAILLAKLLNENSKDIPSNMTELYSKYTEFVLGRWDIDKGLQSQKEYQALDNIMAELSTYMVDNELSAISIDEVKKAFRLYLKKRNLEIDGDDLFNKMVDRCDIVVIDNDRNIFALKHRTFIEFFYAKSMIKNNSLHIDNRIYSPYWMNTFYFYLGIQKDCPDVLRAMLELNAESEPEKWMKIVNMPNYLLAAYTTPYEIISDGVYSLIKEAANLYNDIVTGCLQSPFTSLPRMHILYIMQRVIRDTFSYEFFKVAIEDAALKIHDSTLSTELKAYSLFFLNVAYIDLGADQSFDFMLKSITDTLPIDIALAFRHESDKLKEYTTLMKKQDKRINKKLKHNSSLHAMIKKMYDMPISVVEAKALK
ncbi:MAG: NACHT domain-containing protein [Candidatus Cloacimonetes bacterium]|nr:NACHT domain-containing protein [Candidatus Cloacimonadota bacterium]